MSVERIFVGGVLVFCGVFTAGIVAFLLMILADYMWKERRDLLIVLGLFLVACALGLLLPDWMCTVPEQPK
jgi:hypothetical protein